VVWLTREAKMQEQEDRKRITEAVHDAVTEIEKQEAIGFIGNSLDSVFIRSPFPDDSVMKVAIHDSSEHVMIIGRSEHPEHGPGVPPPPLPPPPPGGHVQFETPVPVPPIPSSMRIDSADVVIRRQERMKSAVEDVMMQYIFSGPDMSNRVSPQRMDSVLHRQFDAKGIDYPFFSTIERNGPEDRFFRDSLSRRDSAWTFRAPLFAGDPSPFRTEVVVHVDPRNQSAIQRILPQLLFAVLLTIGMLVLFLLIYREALKQKKIGDIRRDFINNMTHEFKTPLATMSLAADTIMNEKIIGDKERVRYYAEQIKNENRKLNQQVEKVLELSLTEKQGITLHKEEVNLIDLIRVAMQTIQLQVESRGGSIALEGDLSEMKIMADPFHLERVFLNLMDNAMKYGGYPPVIRISVVPYRSGVEVTISDNGKGIPSSEWNAIFEPFHRVSTGDVHNVKGFGLGLSYAASVVKAHKGSLSVTKSTLAGTTFTLILMHDQ
jgi:two-component system phosphate regulon sensor histidine kinase PhoR